MTTPAINWSGLFNTPGALSAAAGDGVALSAENYGAFEDAFGRTLAGLERKGISRTLIEALAQDAIELRDLLRGGRHLNGNVSQILGRMAAKLDRAGKISRFAPEEHLRREVARALVSAYRPRQVPRILDDIGFAVGIIDNNQLPNLGRAITRLEERVRRLEKEQNQRRSFYQVSRPFQGVSNHELRKATALAKKRLVAFKTQREDLVDLRRDLLFLQNRISASEAADLLPTVRRLLSNAALSRLPRSGGVGPLVVELRSILRERLGVPVLVDVSTEEPLIDGVELATPEELGHRRVGPLPGQDEHFFGNHLWAHDPAYPPE